MPLWGNKDNAANSDIAALMQVSANVSNVAARTALFNNKTAGAFQSANVVVGQFGVDTNEMRAARAGGKSKPAHSGWVLRHEGRGLKAGRVWYETLVAGAIPTTDASDDTYLPDTAIRITTNPTSVSTNAASNVSFSVVASSTPNATLSYKWQKNSGTGWTDIVYTAGGWFNPTTATLTANSEYANANTLRVQVSATGANTVTSANATVLYVV